MPEPIKPESWDGLRDIQRFCRENAVEKGFGREGDNMRELSRLLIAGDKDGLEYFLEGLDTKELGEQILANYYSKRLNLIHDEVSEAHEELRSGRSMAEAYLNGGPGKELKPEGIPSEMSDGEIRYLDLMAEVLIDAASTMAGKLDYNRTREQMHGRKY